MWKLAQAVVAASLMVSAVGQAAEVCSSGSELTKVRSVAMKVLTDTKGMSLYTFDKDTLGASNCTDQCAVAWPPVLVTDVAGVVAPYSVIERVEGSKQLAINGLPLYTFFQDKIPGDIAGDNLHGVWHLVKIPN